MSMLRKKFRDEIRQSLQKSLELGNIMEVPELEKITLNVAVKAGETELLTELVAEVKTIAGQAPVVTKSKKSISNFKLRSGMDIGAKTTLRGDRMYDFLERLIHATLPRIRDFRGLSRKSFDGKGNYNFGIDDHTIFPEIDPDSVKHVHGMNITIVTTAKRDEHACELLTKLGMPFRQLEGEN